MNAVMGIVGNHDKKKKVSTMEADDETASLDLKKRNEELEEELRQSREREKHMRCQLHAAWERVRVAEEAEERFCVQLGELEAEAVQQARDCHVRVVSLMDQLSRANTNPSSISIPSSS